MSVLSLDLLSQRHLTLARLARGSMTVGTGTLASTILSFARNIIIARMLTTEQFGLAMTFALTALLFDMISNLGFDKLIVQSRHGNDPRFQAAGQMLNALRGLVMGLLLFAMAEAIAAWWNAPQAAWAFQCLAVVPILKGLEHLDVRRMQRDLKFAPSMRAEVVPHIVTTLVALPLLLWIPDYSIVLYLVLMHAVLQVGMSHMLAERPYRWAWDRALTRKYLAFGCPLLVNGLLMFAALQADQVLVASAYDLAMLGLYVVAFTLSFHPGVVIARAATTTLLPWLSEVQQDGVRFAQRYRWTVFGMAGIAIMLTVALVLLAETIIFVCFGAHYTAAASVLMVLAVRQGVRLLRTPTVLAQLAHADTTGTMLASGWRAIALLPMIYIAWQGLPIEAIAAMGIIGEGIAYAVSSARLKRKQNLSPRADVLAAIVFTIVCGAAMVLAIVL